MVAEAAARNVENKRHLVTWQMENCVHAYARNQRDAAESMEGQSWENGWTQTSSGPFGVAAIPPTTTATGVPWDSKRKLEPMKKADAERPQPKLNLPLMGGTGKPKSLMQPQPLAEVHPFTPTLHEWQQGIEVNCGPNWSWDAIEAAVARGPHPTASTPEALQVFKEDINYQVRAGFCKVISWEDLTKLRPKNLKISPVACIPQTGRRGRIILNLSFPVFQEADGVGTATQASVNDTTVLQAPSGPVKEIGKVLPRLLQYMRDTPAGLHILFSKLDISDGFWQLIV